MKSRRKIFILIIIVLAVGIMLQFLEADGVAIIKVIQSSEDVQFDRLSVSAETPVEYAEVLILYSHADEGSKKLYNNIYHVFKMTKVNHSFLAVEGANITRELAELRTGDLLVVATERLAELDYYQGLINFVQNGGKVVFLTSSLFEPFDELVGIVENRGFLAESVAGLIFEEKIFPGMDDIVLDNIAGSMLDVDLYEQAKVIATAAGKPLIWTRRYGEGEILYVNSTILHSKTNRGLLLQCIAYLPDYFLTTIFNAIVFNIDDFPAPIKLGKHPEIYDDYFMTTVDFFKRIWWSDTYNFARRHNIRLTGLAMVTFNDDTIHPLEPVNEIEWRQMHYFGRRLAEARGEIGLHGYNHQPLAFYGQIDFEKYGYSPWRSKATMEEGLKILRTTLEEMFGKIRFSTYVPPSNLISREGRLAIKNVFEDVRVFAGLYTGNPDEPGLLLQEFGRDCYVPEVVSFPRISSGYLYSENLMWSIYSVIAHYGLVNHFIHPDDIFCYQRSGGGLSWEELDRELNKIFGEIRKHFPFLRPMTNFEAYQEFLKLENLSVYSRKTEDQIHIYYEQAVLPVYHFLRLRNKRVRTVQGGDFMLLCKERGLYLITGQEAEVKVILR